MPLQLLKNSGYYSSIEGIDNAHLKISIPAQHSIETRLSRLAITICIGTLLLTTSAKTIVHAFDSSVIENP